MKIAEVLLADYDGEISNTRRTLERVPEGRNDFRPHDKSMPLGKLAMHCATLPLFGAYVLEDADMDLAAPRHPHADLTFTTRQHALAVLDEHAGHCRSALRGATDEQLGARWRFSFGDTVISDVSRLQTFRAMFFNHLIHHVAQLGVYLRLSGEPVPALYGPSADESWAPPR